MSLVYTPNALVIDLEPTQADQNPVAVYLSQLAPRSRRTMLGSLDAIALLVSQGKCRAMDFEWQRLRYQHTAAIRSALMDSGAPATSNRHLAALKQVLKECYRLRLMSAEDYTRAVDIKPIKGSTLIKGRALSLDEIRGLFDACAADTGLTGLRDACMLVVLRLGLRRSEVVNLDLKDFDALDGTLHVLKGKGNKDRTAYVPSTMMHFMTNWLEARGNAPGPLLLPVNKHNQVVQRRLTDQAVLYILTVRAKQIGLSKFSPHDFRRTFAGDLLDEGVDIVTVQKLMGHSSPATTSKYDRRGEETKRKASEMLKL